MRAMLFIKAENLNFWIRLFMHSNRCHFIISVLASFVANGEHLSTPKQSNENFKTKQIALFQNFNIPKFCHVTSVLHILIVCHFAGGITVGTLRQKI